jgi:hypothetical protein|uniref:glycosyltransferase 87 family protein n=2 Tax=Cephaloticoccus sp. TaxID=1985742 RepID=UPI0040490119
MTDAQNMEEVKPTRPWRYRLIFVVVILGLHGLFAFIPQLLEAFGVAKLDIWFRDTYAMLAASDSAQAGFDPFVENLYDLIQERHIYSDWWYALGKLGLDRSDHIGVGLAVVVLFWLAVLAVLPLRTARELVWSLALCASPPIWLAVNRANPDLLLFALMTLTVLMLMQTERKVRIMAAVPLALATGLKFFPLLGGVVLLCPAKTRRENWAKGAVVVILLGLLVWSLRAGVENYLSVSWLARGQFTFGAAAVPLKFGLDEFYWIWAGRIIGLGLVVWALVRPSHLGELRTETERKDRLFALMGVAVVAENFFLTVGFLYKILFAIWVLPECLNLAAGKSRFALPARLTVGCLVALVWVMPLASAGSPLWLDWLGSATEAPVRRGVSIVADLLAWGVMVPLVLMFGASLRACWVRGEKWVS